VTDLSQIFLGVIAGATLVMALIQIGAAVMGARFARQAQEALGKAQETLSTAQQTITSVQADLKPLVAKANALADEAADTAAMAKAQVAKVDEMVTDVSARVKETSAIVQQAIVTPAREGLAIFAAAKAMFAALREGAPWRGRPSPSEEEDSLFIG
jgi:hypothetical protein